MIRLFTKDSTGTAPNGRWYAGDINALQDAVAAITDFAQTLSLSVLRIGDGAIQLLKYGTGEARLTAALRTDGIVRALGGLYAGAFTTSARNAISAGSRPYGLVILNTTTNRYEWNAGSDATPSWQPLGLDGAGGSTVGAQPGDLKMSALSSGGTGWLLCDGASYLRATYPALNAVLAADGYKYGSADSTHFNVPDLRGRVPVGRNAGGGTFANLGVYGGEQTHTLSSGEIPAHHHPLTSNGAGDVRHRTIPEGTLGLDTVVNDVGGVSGAITGTWSDVNTGDTGGSGSHNNLQPFLVVNHFIKT